MTSPVVSMTRAEFILEFGFAPKDESCCVNFTAPNGTTVLRVDLVESTAETVEINWLERLYSLPYGTP